MAGQQQSIQGRPRLQRVYAEMFDTIFPVAVTVSALHRKLVITQLQETLHNACNYKQINLKFCELKGENIGIVEKAQETRFGMSPKYSRYIGIAS